MIGFRLLTNFIRSDITKGSFLGLAADDRAFFISILMDLLFYMLLKKVLNHSMDNHADNYADTSIPYLPG